MIPVLSQYLHLRVEVDRITLGPTVPDSTVWRWAARVGGGQRAVESSHVGEV
jgi:hypothetical protein